MDRALIRFQTRVGAYFDLLVPTYPSKLFGDPEPPPAMDATIDLPTPVDEPTADVGTQPESEGTNWAPPRQDASTAIGLTAPVEPPLPPTGPPMYAATHPGEFPVPQPASDITEPKMHVSWLLLLGKGGRRLLVIAIIIGAPVYVARIVNQVHQGVAVVNDQQLVQANNVLVSQITQFESRGKSCQTSSDTIRCLESNDARLSGELTAFVNTLSSNSSDSDISHHFISNAETAARHLASVFHTVSQAGSSESAYKKAANFNVIDTAANNVQVALSQLQTALNNR
jgi:hypothetical protein